jgi:Zn-dependent metalloprotease
MIHCTYHETLQMYTFIFTFREMSAPPRKSRRISKRKEVIQETQNSDTHTKVIGNTENRATAQMIKVQIEAVIPHITNSVIAALSAHGLLFPGNNMANVTQTTNTDNIVTCTSSGLNSNALSTSVRNEDNSNETSQSVNISNNNNASTDTSSLENSTTSMTQQYSQPSFRESLFLSL